MSHNADESKTELYNVLKKQLKAYISQGIENFNKIDKSTINRNLNDVITPDKIISSYKKLGTNSKLVQNSCGISSSMIFNLSKNGRVKIPRLYDVIESIDIGCFHPKEIKNITIYASIKLPKDLSSIDIKNFDFVNFITNDIDLYNSYQDSHYIPLFEYTNTTHIDFLICICNVLYTNLSIEVKFNNPYADKTLYNITLNGLLIDNEKIRLTNRLSYSL